MVAELWGNKLSMDLYNLLMRSNRLSWYTSANQVIIKVSAGIPPEAESRAGNPAFNLTPAHPAHVPAFLLPPPPVFTAISSFAKYRILHTIRLIYYARKCPYQFFSMSTIHRHVSPAMRRRFLSLGPRAGQCKRPHLPFDSGWVPANVNHQT